MCLDIETYEKNELSFQDVGDYNSAVGIYVGTKAALGSAAANPVVILTDYKDQDTNPMANVAVMMEPDLSAIVSVRLLPLVTDADNA